MTTLLRFSIAIALLGGAAIQPTAAFAEPKPTRAQKDASRVHFQAAEAAKSLGDYAQAAAEYLAAYQEFPYPEFLYNAGEVYRLAEDRAKAIEYFEKYLELDPGGRGAPTARSSIEALKTSIAAEQAEAKRRADEEAARSAAPVEPPAPPPIAKPVPDAPPAPRPGRRLRIAGLATGAVGVVAIGASAFFGMRAGSLADEASSAPTYDPDLDDRGEAAERNMFIAGGIGAAAIGTGVVLYVLGRSAGAREIEPLTFVPSLTPSSFAVDAIARF